jgi:hypothetical protein
MVVGRVRVLVDEQAEDGVVGAPSARGEDARDGIGSVSARERNGGGDDSFLQDP